jgi:hypothetical protein
LKKLLLLVVLTSVACIAVAASSAPDLAKLAETDAPPQAGTLPQISSIPPSGSSEYIPGDIQLANSGIVLEVADSDIYTFLRVTTEKGPLWLAASRVAVTKGATVKYSNGVVMTGFYSKALNRTFDLIVFVDRLELEK